MLTDSDAQWLSDRIREAMEEAGKAPADIAPLCGVSRQAVHGWLRTGRVRKRHLPTIAAATGKPLEFFLVPGKEGVSAPVALLLAQLATLVKAAAPAIQEEAIRLIAAYLKEGDERLARAVSAMLEGAHQK